MVPVVGRAFQRQGGLTEVRLILPFPPGVGLMCNRGTVVAVHTHGTVSVIAVEGATRPVNRNLMVVHSQTIPLCVAVREEARLQHAVGRKPDPRHHIGGSERRLFDFREEVFRVAVEFHYSHFHEWVIALGPYLGQIERIQMIRGSLFLGHDLNVYSPTREISILDGFKEITLRAFTITTYQRLRLRVRQVLDALLGAEVELHPETLVLSIDEAEGMAAEQVHVAETGGNAAVAHHNCDLMQGFGQTGPEFPIVLRASHTGAGVAFHGMIEIRKFE